MSEFKSEFCEGEIRVEMPFAVQRYFNILFNDVRPSGKRNAVVIEDSGINRFKLDQLKAASAGVVELKAETERLCAMADDLDHVSRAIERDRCELNRLKSESQAYIKKCGSYDLLRQVHEKIYLNLNPEFNNLLRLADEWGSKVKWVAECYRIESLLIDIVELFDVRNSYYAEERLSYQRQELLRVHESIKEKFKMDFKVLKSLAGDEWCRESFFDSPKLMRHVCNNVDVMSHQE